LEVLRKEKKMKVLATKDFNYLYASAHKTINHWRPHSDCISQFPLSLVYGTTIHEWNRDINLPVCDVQHKP
jgi:hypothetical protein